jgi:2,3-bisphosphoglycerate-independent phosphoglycerate mutase
MPVFANKLVKLPDSQKVGDSSTGPLLLIILDGFGVGKKDKGDCVHLANPPKINALIEEAQKMNLYCELKAHGTAVGLPSDEDMGNSEVGHNALGCGQLVAQGAKLVNIAIENESLFESDNFNRIVSDCETNPSKTVHFVGLLSDGNVHSHVNQLIKMVKKLATRGVRRVRLHALTDGRDVLSLSALEYVDKVEAVFEEINQAEGFDYAFASGGGRMYVTLDRYEADWNIVKRGYDVMVHGALDSSIIKECAEGWTGMFHSTREAIETARQMFPKKTDQDYPPWVIVDRDNHPIGRVVDGDIVVCFNFRGDRAIEISRAFEDGPEFDTTCFDRKHVPKTEFYGLLIYDNEKMIPSKSLCPNPVINNVMTEYLLGAGVTQYACSESHKIGHVTYFWNGNRSGYLDGAMELYEEVKSEPNEAILGNPAMRAREIGEKATAALESGKYKFVRINLANGDMVGHCGHIPQTIDAVKVLDEVVDQLVEINRKLGGITVITADHGNCEEMLDAKGNAKTSHTLNVVPFVIVDPHAKYSVDASRVEQPAGLTNVAASVINLFGYEKPSMYRDSLIRFD